MPKLTWSVIAFAGLAGCGDVKNKSLPDAPSGIDAAVSDVAAVIDGPDVDAAPAGPVRVTVLSTLGDGVPDATAKVLFQAPDGSVVADLAVDVNGHAEALMPAGGTVTAIRISLDNATSLNAALTTTRGVKPGDELTFGLVAAPTPVNIGAETQMTATFTANPNATSVVFYTACSGENGNGADAVKGVVTLTFHDGCHGATFDLVGVGTGANLATPLYLKLSNIMYKAGGAITIPGGFAQMGTFTANLTNIPEVITSLSPVRSSIFGDIAVAAQQGTFADPPAGALDVTVPYPPTVGTRSDVALSLGRDDSQSSQTFAVRTDTLATSVAIDVGTLTVPWLANLKSTPTGATWTTVDAGGTPDGMLVRWAGRWTDGTLATSVSWNVTQPAETVGITLPTLPPAYARLDPAAQPVTVSPGFVTVFFGDYDRVPGYDQWKRSPESLMLSTPSNLGVFVGMPYQRRISISSNIRRL